MSVEIGRQAEARAANWLARRGCKIVARNWRQRDCEIDIVASFASRLYFVEVKYRSNSRQGGGLDYITNRKQSQMKFAARAFMSKYNLRCSYSVCAMSLHGDFIVEAFVEL